MFTHTVKLVGAAGDCEQRAAYWLVRFYDHVSVSLGNGTVSLSSGNHSPEHLARLWRAAMLNETLMDGAHSQRRAVLEQLTK